MIFFNYRGSSTYTVSTSTIFQKSHDDTQARKFVFPGTLYSVSILNLTMDFEHMHCRLQKDVLMKHIEAKLSQEMPRKTCFNPEQDHVFRAMQFAVQFRRKYTLTKDALACSRVVCTRQKRSIKKLQMSSLHSGQLGTNLF